MATVYRTPITLSNTDTLAATTQYYPLGRSVLASAIRSTTEATVAVKYYEPGYFTNLRCYVSANAHTTGVILTLVKNGVDTGVTITVGAGLTGQFEDAINNVTITAGDTFSIKYDPNGGTGNITILMIAADMLAADAYCKYSATAASFSFNTASATRYFGFIGSLVTTNTADSAALRGYVPVAGTAKNLSVYVATNTRATDTVITFLKNGADTGLSVTIPAGATGQFEDTSNTVSLAAGDEVNCKITTGTGGALAISVRGVHFDLINGASDSVSLMMLSSNNNTVANATRYTTLIGSFAAASATESPVSMFINGSGAVKNLYSIIESNSAPADVTVTGRINGSDSSLALTIPASTTGVFSDTTNALTYTPGDTMALEFTRPAGSGALTMQRVSMEIEIDGEDEPLPPSGFLSAWAINSNSIICGGL